MKNIRIFGMEGSKCYASRVARFLGLKLTPTIEKTFADGEPYIKSVAGLEGNVRGCDCYIICSLFSNTIQSVNDKFVKLLYFVGSLQDASAERVTLICPYLSYQRQDRKTESRAGIYTKYSAQLLEAMSGNMRLRLITMDVHNLSAFQSSVRYPVDHLEAKNLFADYLCGGTDRNGHAIEDHIPDPLKVGEQNLVVLSPDAGGLARAKFFRSALERRLDLRNKIEALALDKERKEDGEVQGGHISGTVEGKKVIIYDDVIASGGTIELCSETVEKRGGEVWAICVSHFLPTETTKENLSRLKRIVITNTIPTSLDGWDDRLFVVKTEEMFAESICCTYYGGSISELLA
jgi:ribose-phosphate pyrophosphokinase